jgi:hypothetical protein
MKKTTLIMLGLIILPIIGFGQGIGGTVYPENGSTSFGRNTEINGEGSTVFGADAGGPDLESVNNTFIGRAAGSRNQAKNNVFSGFQAGLYHVNGNNNVYMGYKTGWGSDIDSRPQSSISTDNVFIGSLSGLDIIKSVNNVFIGTNSGRNVISSLGYNTFLGSNSGYGAFGGNNVFLGNRAGYSATGSSNVFIGNYAGYNEPNSNRLSINNNSTTIPLIYGKFKNTQGSEEEENQVGINTISIPAGFTFAVGGKAVCEEVKVALRNSSLIWPDFVFNDEYCLPSLKEVEKHIKEKGHLQNIPSALDVLKDGIFVGEMNAKLLQKIEELTLYALQQQKELEQQKEKNNSLEYRLSKLEFLVLNKK